MSSPAEVVIPDDGASGLDPAGALAARLRSEHGARITGELVVPAKAGQYAHRDTQKRAAGEGEQGRQGEDQVRGRGK